MEHKGRSARILHPADISDLLRQGRSRRYKRSAQDESEITSRQIDHGFSYFLCSLKVLSTPRASICRGRFRSRLSLREILVQLVTSLDVTLRFLPQLFRVFW